MKTDDTFNSRPAAGISAPQRPFYRWAAAVFFLFLLDIALTSIISAWTVLPGFLTGIIHASVLAIISAALLYRYFTQPLIRTANDLRRHEQEAGIAYNVLEAGSAPILITDDQANIEYVNPAFCRITGYSREEVIGKTPDIIKSDRHDKEFYQDMWMTLSETGQWQGEIWDRKKNGEIYPTWLSVSAVPGHTGSIAKYVSIFSDITSLKQAEEHIEYLSHYDWLTGLPNRILFRDRIMQEISQAAYKNQLLTVMVIDIDHFNKINDTFGSFAGDELLRSFTERLAACFSSNETLARLGSDEFAVITKYPDSSESAMNIGHRIIDAMAGSFAIKNHDVFITVSVGIAMHPTDGETAEMLMRNADLAMQKARELGNTVQVYERSMGEKAFTHLSLETNLRHALERDEFVLHYQPLVDLHSGSIIGMEALIRRQERDWLAPPSKFIHIAEKTGLIIQICEWTMQTACRQARQWQAEGLAGLRLSVNVTAGQFYQKTLLQTVRNVLNETGMEPHNLELELTEKIIMRDAVTAIKMMRELKEMGIYLSIDDFGTGYSSLSYLKQFPVDKLKIDLSFVKDLPQDKNSSSISKAIIMLAHSLDLRVIAEGIENRKQLSFMLQHGCDEMQGYYFSRPLPVNAFRELVLSGKRLDG